MKIDTIEVSTDLDDVYIVVSVVDKREILVQLEKEQNRLCVREILAELQKEETIKSKTILHRLTQPTATNFNN